nr:hypothetical protein CFP56_78753 [Quercus suber]
MLDCIAQNKPKNIDKKMKKLFRKRARDYNSDNDEDDDERDVGSDCESEKEEEEAEDMDVNGDNGVSDDEENGKIQPGITMFFWRVLEHSRWHSRELSRSVCLRMHFKFCPKQKVKGEAKKEKHLVGEKGHVKPANYLDSYEKFLIGVATKWSSCLML